PPPATLRMHGGKAQLSPNLGNPFGNPSNDCPRSRCAAQCKRGSGYQQRQYVNKRYEPRRGADALVRLLDRSLPAGKYPSFAPPGERGRPPLRGRGTQATFLSYHLPHMAAVPEPPLILNSEDARHLVEAHAARLRPRGKELVELLEAAGQVLAEPIFADRNFPPFPRAMRD